MVGLWKSLDGQGVMHVLLDDTRICVPKGKPRNDLILALGNAPITTTILFEMREGVLRPGEGSSIFVPIMPQRPCGLHFYTIGKEFIEGCLTALVIMPGRVGQHRFSVAEEREIARAACVCPRVDPPRVFMGTWAVIPPQGKTHAWMGWKAGELYHVRCRTCGKDWFTPAQYAMTLQEIEG